MGFSRKDFFLICLALVGFAVAQPLFSILQATPEFLVIRRAKPSEVISLALALTIFVPVVAVVVREILKFSKNITFLFDVIVFWVFSTILIQLYTKNIIVSVVGGTLLVLGICRLSKMREILRFASIGTPIFGIIFLWTTLSTSFLSADLSKDKSEVIKNLDRSKLKPTFLIIFDEFPLFSLLNSNQQINKERFPGFYKLSQLSTWFRNGSAVTSWTERAVPAILGGVLPSTDHVQTPSIKDYPQNIFTLFSKTHRVFGYEQVTNLCPQSVCPELRKPEPFFARFETLMEDIGVIFAHRLASESQRAKLPSLDGKWGEFLPKPKSEGPKRRTNKGLDLNEDYGDDVVLFDRFISDLEKDIRNLAEGGINPLSVVHITFPHVPYRYLPNGSKYALDRDIGNDREYTALWPVDAPGLSATAMQRFLMQAAVADKLIQKFLETLEKANLLNTSVIAVTADHGTSFKLGEYSRRPSDKNYSDVLSVPFFVSLPGQSRAGEVNDDNVSSVDILPTILELNGLSDVADSRLIAGKSLLHKDQHNASKKVFFPLVGDQKKVELTYPKTLDRTESVQRMATLFGEGGFDQRFYEADFTQKQLLGKNVSEVKQFINQDLIVGIHKSEKYKKLRLTPGFIPALISGVVRYHDKRPMDSSRKTVAITLADKVVAVAQTDKIKEEFANFLALIPPHLLKEGDNQLKGVVIK